jgi:hypothetical protein
VGIGAYFAAAFVSRIGYDARMPAPEEKSPEFDPTDQPAFPPTDETGDVDLSLIDAMLALTPAERLRRVGEMMEFMEIQRRLRIKRYGFDPAADAIAETAE